MAEHARLSPSAAERWMTCPGSVALSDHFPDEISYAACEGTFAHTIREKCLKEGKGAVDFVGYSETVEDWTFEWKLEDCDLLQKGIDWIREQPGDKLYEYRVDLGAWMPGQFGTLDTAIIHKDLLVAFDLKWGRGVTVLADHNPQLMLYAAGLWSDLPTAQRSAIKRVRLIIDQPRGQGGTWREWECSIEDILRFAEEASVAAARTEDPDAPLAVTPKGCQFCVVGANFACPEQHQFFAEIIGMKEELELPEIDQLSPERRSFIIQHAPLIKKWLESCHGLQLDHALKGLPTPGFKAVATTGDRSWTNEEAAEEFWKSKMPAKEIYTTKLKSPAQMERVAGTRNWKAAQELIQRAEGKPALVPETDPREPLVPLLSLLDDIDDGEVIEDDLTDDLI